MAAAVRYAVEAGLPARWLVGWSFGTELALKWGLDADASALKATAPDASPPTRAPRRPRSRARSCCRLRCTGPATPTLTGGPRRASRWPLVPELDDYLRPDEARRRFARVPSAEVIAVDRAKHLWVGEPYVRIALNEIVRRVNPAALVPPTMTLPTHWEVPTDA